MRGRSQAPGHEGDHGPHDHGAAGWHARARRWSAGWPHLETTRTW